MKAMKEYLQEKLGVEVLDGNMEEDQRKIDEKAQEEEPSPAIELLSIGISSVKKRGKELAKLVIEQLPEEMTEEGLKDLILDYYIAEGYNYTRSFLSGGIYESKNNTHWVNSTFVSSVGSRGSTAFITIHDWRKFREYLKT